MATSSTDTSSELSNLRAEVSRLSEVIANRARSEADSAGQMISDTMADLGKRSKEVAAVARDKVQETGFEVEDAISRNPWGAVMIAGGIGLVLGMLSRQRD